jgi:hypothetical protein
MWLMSLRPFWATQHDPISKDKKRKEERKGVFKYEYNIVVYVFLKSYEETYKQMIIGLTMEMK